MFRIAVYYESGLGRNDGNPLYVSSFLKRTQFFCDVARKRNQNDKLLFSFPGKRPIDPLAQAFSSWVLENLDPEGIEVVRISPHGDMKPYGKFDLNVWVDWGEDGLKGVLPYEPEVPGSPLLYWASDTHLGFDYRLEMARRADLAFVAQKRAVSEFRDKGVTAEWLPHAVEPMAYPCFELASKKHDVCFVGHVNNARRIEMLDRAFREFPNFYFGQKLFDEASHKYAESKVVLNIAMTDDVNMRVFEVLGSGSFLLTDELPDLHELFVPGKHFVTYKNLDEMVEKARYYIQHDAERQAIADAGHQAVLANHTIAHRVRTMLQSFLHAKEKVNVPIGV